MSSWPHAPFHSFNEAGTYMVTAATSNKEKFFKEHQELDFLQQLLLELAIRYQWKLEAWAIFSNHYHFIAQSPAEACSLGKFITHLHASSAKILNERHKTAGRKVWYQYWDSRITFQSSYLARINYVMQNPVKHKLVIKADQYKWCSASWFENNVPLAYLKTVMNLNTENVHLIDDF